MLCNSTSRPGLRGVVALGHLSFSLWIASSAERLELSTTRTFLAESLLSLPKRWLSTQGYSADDDEFQFAAVVVSPQQVEHTRGLVRGFMEELGPRLQEALLDRQKETDNWMEHTQELMSGFMKEMGPRLQETLLDQQGDMVNWITEWWLDDMYLKIRLPLPINSNPGMVFPKRHFAKMDEVADLGALFIDDLLDYKEMLDRGELPLERATSREKGQPLCMEQFYRLLGVCRVPEFYPIPVKAADRGRLTPGEIQAQLLHVMVDAAGLPAAPRVDENNRTNMELISRALCILCLDEAGTRHHSANRWFDKIVQVSWLRPEPWHQRQLRDWQDDEVM
ncbi:unnamed protein product [Chilo suppressalis]|uniref:Choline/carnitine acyltransferase domain-containing protein n=1 Tax=Chilo suppressalis TaxID=168631 RepID=A0ABN8B0Y5_CHISP|nr:unnamed protein product [Chilo suppressalis]